jgi:hypothetical protein
MLSAGEHEHPLPPMEQKIVAHAKGGCPKKAPAFFIERSLLAIGQVVIVENIFANLQSGSCLKRQFVRCTTCAKWLEKN